MSQATRTPSPPQSVAQLHDHGPIRATCVEGTLCSGATFRTERDRGERGDRSPDSNRSGEERTACLAAIAPMPRTVSMLLSLIACSQMLLSGVDALAQRDRKTRSSRADSRSEAEAAMDLQTGGLSNSESVNALFSKADLDDDGVLSRPEMAHMVAQLNAAAATAGTEPVDYFEVMDDDGDGHIDRGEAAAFFVAILGSDKEEL